MSAQPSEPGGAADRRREQLLRAAMDVVVERGYADTRIADVASRAGTSPALVIYYFKTKEQLLTEAVRLAEDGWYDVERQRMAELPSAAARLEELVAMCCLTERDTDHYPWAIWLEVWAQSIRNPEVARVRQLSDDRLRETIQSIVADGLRAGEFRTGDAVDFALGFSALLDGLAIRMTLADTSVDADHAYRIGMAFAAQQLGFRWTPRRRRLPSRRRMAGRS